MSRDASSAGTTLTGGGRSRVVPRIFLLQAVQIAASADDLLELLRVMVGREKPPRTLPPPPKLDAWLRMHRSHRRVMDGIGSAFGMPEDCTATQASQELLALLRLPKEYLEASLRTDPEGCAVLASMLRPVFFPPDDATLRGLLTDLDRNQGEDERETPASLLVSLPAGRFFFRVWLPCWVLHRTYPTLLLRRARSGNDDAMDALLRLDKSIVADPVIARRWHTLAHDGSLRDRQRFRLAMADGPKGRLDRRSVRLGLVGMIGQLAAVFGVRVSAPDIAGLFDSIARVRDSGPDRHIPVGEALTKASRRNKNWPSLPEP